MTIDVGKAVFSLKKPAIPSMFDFGLFEKRVTWILRKPRKERNALAQRHDRRYKAHSLSANKLEYIPTSIGVADEREP